MKKAVFGTFAAEQYWRSAGLCSLPALRDPMAAHTVSAMDELLFPFCDDGDILITRYALDHALRKYLGELGFAFVSNDWHLAEARGLATAGIPAVCELLLAHQNVDLCRALLGGITSCSPYAVIPPLFAVSERMGMEFDGPPVSVVERVNSKVYSHALRRKLDAVPLGEHVTSSASLTSIGWRYLQVGPIIVKDPMGVAGTGNIVVRSLGVLNRIATHVQEQEDSGRQTSFVVEPYLDKLLDFSCQLRVFRDRPATILAVQKTINDGCSYAGSSVLDRSDLVRLVAGGYLDVMASVGEHLRAEGYSGYACVDSMVLRDGRLVPIVEINARKSMGLIAHMLAERLCRSDGLDYELLSLPLAYSQPDAFARLFCALDAAHLLYRRRCREGLVPLSSGALMANSLSTWEKGGVRRGRLFVFLVGVTDQRRRVVKKLLTLLESLDFRAFPKTYTRSVG